MLTSREFKALEDGKIITKISIFGSEGNLIKTVPLDQAKVHKLVLNHCTKEYLFTLDEAKQRVITGIADSYTAIQGEKNFVHCIKYIDRTYGRLVHQFMVWKLSVEQITGRG